MEPVFKTVVAASADHPCPKRRTSVSAVDADGRDRTLIYSDTPVDVPVKNHPDARYYRRRLAKGDLAEAGAAPAKPAAKKAATLTKAAGTASKE